MFSVRKNWWEEWFKRLTAFLMQPADIPLLPVTPVCRSFQNNVSQDGKKKTKTFFLQHLGRVNSWLCLLIQKGHDLIFSHFERAIVCVLCVWNWMVSPFREQRRGNDLYSPAVSERSWGGAEKESKRGWGGRFIELPLCDNGLLWRSHTHGAVACLSINTQAHGVNGQF